MCGIAGIISVSPQQISAGRLLRMTDAVSHRGPDGSAWWIDPSGMAGFGHRRLAIIDLSPEAGQPMHYLDRYTIIHNGEIYNYLELKQELLAKGYHFTTQSDTEVILAAFDCWKEDCLAHFDGMFAFAIWDEHEGQLFAARDRFGEKPFFFCFCDGAFLFGSEMKALWAAGMQKEVNKRLLYNFLTLGYTQNPSDPLATAYANIYKLPAATWFRYSPRQALTINPKRYWHPLERQMVKDPALLEEEFRELLTTSVKHRLRSDASLGTSLSGGLDSSSIAAMIPGLQGGKGFSTFSAVFPGFASDESAHIRQFCEEKKLANFSTTPTAGELVADIDQLCRHQEGPISSASIYAQYRVYALAARHQTKVLLDGQGADETLAGYHKYFHWFWQELYRYQRPLLAHEMKAVAGLGISVPWSWKNKLAALFPQKAQTAAKRRKAMLQQRYPFWQKDFAETYGQSWYEMPLPDRLNNVLYYNVFSNGLEELLQYADRNAMAHGVELRLPFLYHPLVEFMLSLPANFKIRDGETKWLLRKAMKPLLPASILNRHDKIGFEPPQFEWMQHVAIQDMISQAKRKLVQEGILTEAVLAKKIQPHSAYAAESGDWRFLSAAKLF